jgi:hypothetical protein
MAGGVLLLMGVLVQQQAGKGLFGDSKTEQTEASMRRLTCTATKQSVEE